MKLFTWTKELEQELGLMWLNGYSSGVIGEKLGVGRSAVMGKLDRMGLLKEKRGRPTVTLPRGVPVRATPTGEPMPKHLKIYKLKNNQCRWPYGTHDYTFCGHRTDHGKVYCAYHDRKSKIAKD